jgi:hypothetical protein
MFKKILIQFFCNFTISLIGTLDIKESMKFNVQQQNRIFPLRLENDTFCFQGLKPNTSYKIIVQKNKTELYSYQVHTLSEPIDVSKYLSLLGLLPLLLIIPIAIAFGKFLVKSVSYPFVNFTKFVCNLLL